MSQDSPKAGQSVVFRLTELAIPGGVTALLTPAQMNDDVFLSGATVGATIVELPSIAAVFAQRGTARFTLTKDAAAQTVTIAPNTIAGDAAIIGNPASLALTTGVVDSVSIQIVRIPSVAAGALRWLVTSSGGL